MAPVAKANSAPTRSNLSSFGSKFTALKFFRKQIYCITCDIVGTFGRHPQLFGARGIVPVAPLLSPCTCQLFELGEIAALVFPLFAVPTQLIIVSVGSECI